MPTSTQVAHYQPASFPGIYGTSVYGPADVSGSLGSHLLPPSSRALMPPAGSRAWLSPR